MNEIGEGENKALLEYSLGQQQVTRSALSQAHLREASSLGCCKAIDESFEQLGQDRPESTSGFPNEVDHKIADEQPTSLRLRRLEKLGDLCEDELESRLASLVMPAPRD